MPKPIELDSGNLSFVFRDGEKSHSWDTDLITVKLTCERIEDKHKLVQKSGIIQGNAAFFADLGKELVAIGCPVATPTVAARVWGIVNDKFNASVKDLAKQIAR
ncbi:hypothetical protein Pla52o_35080 [Novipirellula galeiformis]|uniref:Uncharacterized protein n=1 Tax=Novipirellula galeiformis TaxID=2528004 RepID=A0A5C6CEC4_9BACT|nr:hypothetical protein [Novipirellula galeiformis]TWU22452.1 hypothetical protein Pla52o_35080 [Novipirellula galeiformis]